MKNKISIILLCIICVTCCCVSVFGNGFLQQIYVDLKPINVVIDGENKNPPSDMQPMMYNDRTYVPLRYVAESLGKDVDWDGDTRTVYIGEHQPLQTEIFESFTGPVSKNWEMSGSWTADGPNGYNGGHHSTITLLDFFPNKQSDFTIELEYLMPNENQGFYIYLGKDNKGNFADEIEVRNYNWGDYIKLDNQTCGTDIQDDIYHSFKFTVSNGQCFVYIDDNYVHTFKLESEIPNVTIKAIDYLGRVRNINVKIND